MTLRGTLCEALTGGPAADAVVQKRASLSPPLERIWAAFLRQGTFHAVFGAVLFSQHALRVTRFYNQKKDCYSSFFTLEPHLQTPASMVMELSPPCVSSSLPYLALT